MADFRPSSYRCHVYELWSEDCRFIGDISVLQRAPVTDDKSPLFQSPAGKTGRLTGNPMDRVDAYQPTFPRFRWLRGQLTRWAS
jgi:hypothetical protein